MLIRFLCGSRLVPTRMRLKFRALTIATWINRFGYEDALRLGRERGWIRRVDKDWNVYLCQP